MGDDGIQAFAKERGLREAAPEIRPLTPALVGDGAEVRALFQGDVADGFAATICRRSDRSGTTALVVGRVPESAAFVPALICRDRAAAPGSPAQLPVERWTGTRLESEEFNRRFRLLTLAGQDAGWLRELFSPALISWLAHEAPPGLSWELNDGNLVVFSPAAGSGEEVARLAAAAADLAARIRAEVAEEEVDPDLFDESSEAAALSRAVERVRFDQPPGGVQEAIGRYRRAAARRPGVLLNALATTVVAAGLVMLAVNLFTGPVAAIIAGLIVAVPVFWLARLIAASRHRWEGISVSRAGLEAFVRHYAESRGLVLEDRWGFHAAHRHVPMPGFADHVLFGRQPEVEREGRLLLLADAAELRALGTEVAYTAVRPHASNALLVRLDAEPAASTLRDVKPPEEYRVECSGRDLLIWRPIPGNLIRTAAGCDRFRERAGRLAAEIAG